MYSQIHEAVFYLNRATGEAVVELPESAQTYYPSYVSPSYPSPLALSSLIDRAFQPPLDDFDRMCLTTFLAADRFGRGYITAEEFVGLMRAPELNFQLNDQEVCRSSCMLR